MQHQLIAHSHLCILSFQITFGLFPHQMMALKILLGVEPLIDLKFEKDCIRKRIA